jgi:hypothetical protein
MVLFSNAISSGAMGSLVSLDLMQNAIGDAGRRYVHASVILRGWCVKVEEP